MAGIDRSNLLAEDREEPCRIATDTVGPFREDALHLFSLALGRNESTNSRSDKQTNALRDAVPDNLRLSEHAAQREYLRDILNIL